MTKKRCVLFVHGFLGGPRQFDRLVSCARERGLDAFAPALPGHGGDAAAFIRARPADWQACVHRTLIELRGQYDEIFIVTHSMGGLLALHETARDARRIAGVACLALPLRIRVTPACVRLWLAVGLFPHRIKNPRLIAARDACSVSGISIKSAARFLPNALGLLRLARDARRDILSSRVPLTVVRSPRDEIVAPSSAALAERAGASARALRRSGHFWYAEDDLAVIDAALDAMWGVGAQAPSSVK